MTTQVTTGAAAMAAAFILSAAPLRAREPVESPAPAEAATPAPASTPLPILMEGPSYETLRSLSAALETEARHALDGTLAAANAGRYTRVFMPGLRMFSRRTEWLHRSIDEYRTKPFDVVSTVDTMNTRVAMLSRRMKHNPGLQHTVEDWDNITDLLDRMQKLLAGQTVTVPPPHTPRPVPTPAAGAVPPMLAPNATPEAAPPAAAAAPRPSPTPTPK
jgi:hypothetical protein